MIESKLMSQKTLKILTATLQVLQTLHELEDKTYSQGKGKLLILGGTPAKV